MGTFPSQVVLTKAIPESSWYTKLAGDTPTCSIVINATSITVNSKRNLIKINQAQSNQSQATNPSDQGKSFVYDLKRVEDNIRIGGWLADDANETAWNKAWKLRAMCVAGNMVVSGVHDKGALSSCIIDNIAFNTSTQRVFLETITFTANPTQARNLTDNAGTSVARVEIDLNLYVGNPK
jgi:hypothetical protein